MHPALTFRTLRPALTGFAFLLFLLTAVPGYMPGESAFALNQALPGSSFPTFGHTLWHSLVRGIAAIPLGGFSARLAVFNAGVGAIALWAAMGIIRRIPVGLSPEEDRTPAAPQQVRTVMTAVTVLTFLFSPPLWFAATRPLPQMFGLMLLLCTGLWTLTTFQERSPKKLNLAAAFWGLLVTEYATAWFFLPIFLLMVLLTGFTPEGRFRIARNVKLAAIFLLAATVGYFLMALHVAAHPHAPLQEIHHLGDAFLNSLRVQRNLLTQAAPTQGALLILFLFGGPFFWALFPKASGNLDVRIGSVLLHFACAVVNAFMLFHPGYSPWGMYLEGRLAIFMVVPSAMLAISTGYLAGYWMNVLAKWDPYQPYVIRTARRWLRAIVRPLIALLVLASTVINLLSFADPDVRNVNQLAARMAASLEGSTHYIGNSGFNDVLRLHLRDQGLAVRVIDLEPQVWVSAAYREIIAAQFEEISPRLASMARVGPGPFLQTLMQTGDLNTASLRFGEVTDLIQRSGLVPVAVPFGLKVAEAFPADDPAGREALFDLWASLEPGDVWARIQQPRGRGRAAVALATFFAQQSLMANNFGYQLEGVGADADAFRAYRLARHLREDNLSALLNLAMRLDDLPAEVRPEVEAEMEAFLAEMGEGRLNRAQLWRLAGYFGYIRHPSLMLERGWAWVVSGNPQVAVPELQEALARFPGAESLRLQLAFTHFAGQDLVAAESEYLRVLEENPDSGAALLGMSRIAALRGEVDEALAYLERLRQLGAQPGMIRREEVAALSLAGRVDEAAERVELWLRQEPENPQALLSRLVLAETRGDRDLRTATLDRLERSDQLGASERLMLARLLVQSGAADRARRQLRPLLTHPEHRLAALELSLRMEVNQRNQSEAERLVRELLAMDPRHAYGNYILGSLLLHRGNVREAISAFETSIAREPSSGALNDLAFTLLQRGEARRALTLVDQALALDASSPHAYGTRAAVLLRLQEPAEALRSIEQALRLAPDHPPFLITLGRALLAQGQVNEARALVDRLLNMQAQFPSDTLREFQDLSAAVRTASQR